MGQGIWIWENAQAKKDEYADFSTTFSLGEQRETVNLEISADSHYAAYVNGHLAAFGQYGDFPHWKVGDKHDITAFCRAGENELRVTAWHLGETAFCHHPQPAGVRFQVTAGGRTLAFSGAHTLCRRNPNYVSHRQKLIFWILGYSFRYDAAAAQTPWHPAVPTGWQPQVHPRPVDKLELWETVPGRVIGGNGSTHFLLDLGREEAGFLELSLYSDTKQNIVIAYGEHLVDGAVPRFLENRDFSVEYGAVSGENRYLNPFRRLGCRYLEVFAERPVRLESMGIRPTMYPVTVLPFDAGSPRRQRIYDTAVRTLRLCIHEHYEDCPWREQSLYGMDSRNQMLFGYYAFGETAMPRASLALFGLDRRDDGLMAICAPTDFDLVIPSFILHWYQAVLEYTEFSGDLTLVRELWEKMCGVLAVLFRFRDPETGLLECLPGKNYWNFYEWTDEKLSDPEHTNQGVDLLLNLLMLRALQAMERMGALTGLECGLCREAEGLRRGIRRVFRRDDGLFATDPAHSHVCELGCALAILTGVAEAEEARAMCRLFTREDKGEAVAVSLSMAPFVYDALLQTDRQRYASFVLEDIDRRCGYMLDQGATTFWETMEGWRDFRNAGSLCHGWSAMAVYYYRQLLG